MKTLIIIQDTVVGGGAIKTRGEQHKTDNQKEIYDLVAAGRALDLSTKEGKEVAEQLEEDAKAAAKAKK